MYGFLNLSLPLLEQQLVGLVALTHRVRRYVKHRKQSEQNQPGKHEAGFIEAGNDLAGDKSKIRGVFHVNGASKLAFWDKGHKHMECLFAFEYALDLLRGGEAIPDFLIKLDTFDMNQIRGRNGIRIAKEVVIQNLAIVDGKDIVAGRHQNASLFHVLQQ